jgi:hypothetical protein
MARVKAREPWVENSKPLSQVGVFQLPRTEYWGEIGADEGVTRMLTQLKITFDVVRRDPDSDWSAYELLILPDGISGYGMAMIGRLQNYLKRGGKLLVTGTSLMDPDGKNVLLPELGIEAHGLSPFTTQYIRFNPEIAADVPPTDHVIYDRSVQVTATGAGKVVAQNVEPYFERAWNHFSSHVQTPADKVSRYAAAVLTPNSAYIAAPIFGAYIRHGNYPYRLLVRNILEKLLPDRWVGVKNAPLSLEVSVMRQAERGGRLVVHLLNYTAERRTATLDIIEDIAVLRDVELSLKYEKKPTRVYLAPEKVDLQFQHANSRLGMKIPQHNGHAMVVIE